MDVDGIGYGKVEGMDRSIEAPIFRLNFSDYPANHRLLKHRGSSPQDQHRNELISFPLSHTILRPVYTQTRGESSNLQPSVILRRQIFN